MKPARTAIFLSLLFAIEACTRSAPASRVNPAGPFVPLDGVTAVPLELLLPPTRGAGTPILTPTPDAPHSLPTQRSDVEQYVVQAGDSLGVIAEQYGVSAEAVAAANKLADPNQLEIGQVLTIPVAEAGAAGSAFKIIPDSELVHGPASLTLNLPEFIQYRGGYLAQYSEEVEGEILDGAAIVQKVAGDYSINPRLLLAVLEQRGQWISNPNPEAGVLEYPLAYYDPWRAGLYRQLAWAADELNRGYYAWKAGSVSSWVLADGSVVPVDATINAGTAAVQHLFARLDDRPAWEKDVSYQGLFQTYFFLFGYPFDLAIEPLRPAGLAQPKLELPFPAEETWLYTGGPHGGWGGGSAWAALDFAPPGEPQGCISSEAWVTAVADGLILRAKNGAVIQDLDGDGFEQTGWVILYMHVENRERVLPGTVLKAGERVGHPSCEGGLSNGTHLHIARRYNGEWIPADSFIPFVLSGWRAESAGSEYDGYLRRDDQVVEAWEGNLPENQIQH